MLRTFTLAYSWQNHLTQNLFFIEVLTISCNSLNTVLKVKARMAKCTGSLPS